MDGASLLWDEFNGYGYTGDLSPNNNNNNNNNINIHSQTPPPTIVLSEVTTDFTINMNPSRPVVGEVFSRYNHSNPNLEPYFRESEGYDVEGGNKITPPHNTFGFVVGFIMEKLFDCKRLKDYKCVRGSKYWRKICCISRDRTKFQGSAKSSQGGCNLTKLAFFVLLIFICFFFLAQFIFLQRLTNTLEVESSQSYLWLFSNSPNLLFFNSVNNGGYDTSGAGEEEEEQEDGGGKNERGKPSPWDTLRSNTSNKIKFNKLLNGKHVIREQWKHYDRGKDALPGGTPNHGGEEKAVWNLEHIIIGLILKEMTTSLNEYLWKLSLDLTPSLSSVRETLGDDPHIIIRSNLTDIVEYNVQARLNYEFHVESKEKQSHGGGSPSNDALTLSQSSHRVDEEDRHLITKFHYQRKLQHKVKEIMSTYISWLFLESSSYRCCCVIPGHESLCGPKHEGSIDELEAKDLVRLGETLQDWRPACMLVHQPNTLEAQYADGEDFLDQFILELEFQMKLPEKGDLSHNNPLKCSLQMIADEEFYLPN